MHEDDMQEKQRCLHYSLYWEYLESVSAWLIPPPLPSFLPHPSSCYYHHSLLLLLLPLTELRLWAGLYQSFSPEEQRLHWCLISGSDFAHVLHFSCMLQEDTKSTQWCVQRGAASPSIVAPMYKNALKCPLGVLISLLGCQNTLPSCLVTALNCT